MSVFKNDVTDPVALRFLEADAFLRSVDGKDGKDFTVEAIACFFYIASHEGCHKQAMEKALNLSIASSSRNTDLLSKYHRLKQPDGRPRPGLNLIVKREDTSDRRRQLLYLTTKGKEIIKEFKSIIYHNLD